MRLPPPFATLDDGTSHRGNYATKGDRMMRLTTEWVKVLVAALTLLALAVHALTA